MADEISWNPTAPRMYGQLNHNNFFLSKYPILDWVLVNSYREKHWLAEDIRKVSDNRLRIYRLLNFQVVRTTFSQFRPLRDLGETNTHITALDRSLSLSQILLYKVMSEHNILVFKDFRRRNELCGNY